MNSICRRVVYFPQNNFFIKLAQLVRASVYRTEGRRFISDTFINQKSKKTGSVFIESSLTSSTACGELVALRRNARGFVSKVLVASNFFILRELNAGSVLVSPARLDSDK